MVQMLTSEWAKVHEQMINILLAKVQYTDKWTNDNNAALNILEEGLKIIGLSSPEYTPVENPTMDDRTMFLRSSDSMKQEKNEIH